MLDIFRKIYLNSFVYDKKISKIYRRNLKYKPGPHFLTSIVQIQKKKFNIEDFSLESVWDTNRLNHDKIYKLNNFFWLFSLDLKSPNASVQSVIKDWIKINFKYDSKSWSFNTTAKRLIAWLSNSKLTYEEGNEKYRKDFDLIVQKQTLHLLSQIDKEANYANKLVGTAAIILTGLCYDDEKNFTQKGLNNLKKIIKNFLDNSGFPKSRNINTSIFFLKYMIIIREWFRESQSEIPEFINESIFYLGQSYAFFCKNLNFDPLFNGNNISNNIQFDFYLKRFDYFFNNNNYELSNYIVLRNKKINFIMDVGSSPNKKFSHEYKAGALSFEFSSNGEKIFTNAGYYDDKNSQLNELSKSSAVHNVLIIDDNSSCKFKKIGSNFELKDGLKVIKKSVTYDKDYWKIIASHDGYLKKYNLIYEREIEFNPKINKLIGNDRLISKKNISNLKFDIRFHLDPSAKIMMTQDNKSIFIEIKNEGWKFICNNFKIDIDNGLYFGKKNTYVENQNIFISGITNKNTNIKWELIKI